MTPKSLLRHKQAVSPVDQLTVGHFHDVIDDPAAPERARRVLFCSGKVYYDLAARRAEVAGQRDVAIIRIEQLYPWPLELLTQHPDAVSIGPGMGLGAGRVAEHGSLDVRRAAPARAARRPAFNTSGATRAPAPPRARSSSTTASRPRSSKPPSAWPCLTWSPPREFKNARSASASAAGSELTMPSVPVTVPSVGESISEGILARWHKADGSLVKAGEPLFELETDKATSDVPAAGSGVLRIAVKEGETVAVGATVATIDPADSTAAAAPAAKKEPAPRRPRTARPHPPYHRHLAGSSARRCQDRRLGPQRHQGQPLSPAVADRHRRGRRCLAESPPPGPAAGSPRATSSLISSRRALKAAGRARCRRAHSRPTAAARGYPAPTAPAKPASA